MATEAAVLREPLTEVAAAVLIAPDGRFLLAQRPAAKAYAGYWEFPGGKVEPLELIADALSRELYEELGIRVTKAYPWITQSYSYPHAHVRLNFFRVMAWEGELHPHEGQAFKWQDLARMTVSPVLPANGPVLKALALPNVCGITCAGEIGVAPFLARLETALAGGLRLVQIREKRMSAEQLEAFGREVIARCRCAGARVALNGELAVAERIGADGVHLPAAHMLSLRARPDIGICGGSCHDPRELEHAALLGLDFVVLGPVHPTPTHSGAVTLGWEGFGDLARGYSLPIYALGGMWASDLTTAWEHSAHGIAMVRGAWSS